jgi:hypothetical protein
MTDQMRLSWQTPAGYASILSELRSMTRLLAAATIRKSVADLGLRASALAGIGETTSSDRQNNGLSYLAKIRRAKSDKNDRDSLLPRRRTSRQSKSWLKRRLACGHRW